MTVDYTSIKLLQTAAIAVADRRSVNSEFLCSLKGSCLMTRIRPGHIFGRSHRLEFNNLGTVLWAASLRPGKFRIIVARVRRSIMSTNLLLWWVLVPGAIVVVAYLIYQAAMPTPLPGIPYKTASASRLLGDLPNMLRYTARTRETVSFFASHCVELNSPISQIFIRPFFCKPWVIITDSHE
jgi:hypothetical protein